MGGQAHHRLTLAAVGLALSLTACATTTPPEPTIVTRTVSVPVAVACRPDLGQPPQYPATPEAITAAPDIYARAKLLVAELLLRRGREAELQAAIEACAK